MRGLAAVALVLFGFARAAEAVTIRDIMELSRAGLGDEVLLALVEVNRGVYAIDSETLKALKAAGVSDRVIAALVRSGRETFPEPAPPATAPVEADAAPGEGQAPQVVIIDRAPVVREVLVPVPVYVTSPRPRHRQYPETPRAVQAEPAFVPFRFGPPVTAPAVQESKGEPVYWGFGGKLRPDAWAPEGARPKKEQGK